jgi:uncharacterized protein
MKLTRIKFLSLSLLFVTSSIQGADLDCAGDLNDVEKLVCVTPELLKLNFVQNAAFKRLIQRSSNPDVRKSEQRAWVRDVRDNCPDVGCLKTAYDQRNYALKFDEPWMTDRRALAICRNVLESVNTGTLQDRFIPFAQADKKSELSNGYYIRTRLQLEHNGRTRQLGMLEGGGACRANDIRDLDQKVIAPYPPDDKDQQLRWSSFGRSDHLIRIGSDLIIIKMDRENNIIGLVSWLAPDGAGRPLCYLEPIRDDFEIVNRERRDHELCDAVVMQEVDIVPWPKWEAVRLAGRGRFGSIDRRSTIEVDLNHDGEKEAISLLDYASGAGCGFYRQWLSAADEYQDKTVAASLRSVFGENIPNGSLPGGWSYPKTHPGPGSIKVFRYKNKPYIMTRSSMDPAGRDRARVISVWGNKIKHWCELYILTRHKIYLTFPLKTWPMPEPLEKIEE